MTRIVLDTNVLVSALLKKYSLPALCLDAGLSSLVQIIVTEEILQEYRVVLLRPQLRLNKELVKAVLKEIELGADLVKPTCHFQLSRDPDDNKFLNASHAGQADFIITGNKLHFPKKFYLTKIVSPAEFVVWLGQQAFL